MVFSSETATWIGETFCQGLRQLAGGTVYREPGAYFDPGEPRPDQPGYFDACDRINDAFDQWLDPGPVTAPAAHEIRREHEFLRFPSPCPAGDPEVDRVALKLYPAPARAPEVGVLFHHWLSISSFLPVDWLLSPLTRRFRVAAMVAPHHLMRRAAGMRSGEGFVNPNPRYVFEGFRQWEADHMACLELLHRDHGFAGVVVVGYSLGGYGALLHRLLRPALPTVAICTTNCYARGVFEGGHTAQLAQRLREAGFTLSSFRRATRSLHLVRWAQRIGGDELTWIYARHDGIEPQDSLREARRALRPERVVAVEGGHATAAWARRRIIDEISRRLERLCPEPSQPASQEAPERSARPRIRMPRRVGFAGMVRSARWRDVLASARAQLPHRSQAARGKTRR